MVYNYRQESHYLLKNQINRLRSKKREEKMTLEQALEKLNSGNCPSGLKLDFSWNYISDKGA